MKLTIEENPERIRRFSHIKPAPRWGVALCSASCPGVPRTCTLKRGHAGPHVAHGAFRRVVAVWDKGIKLRKVEEKNKRAVRTTVRSDTGEGGPVAALWALWGRIARKEQSMEEVFLLLFALSMVGFAIDWAARILGFW